MENKTKEFFEKHKNDMVKMKEQLPDVAGSFSVFFGKVMKDGALSLKEKELIAVAIGSRSQMQVRHSVPHTKKRLDAGATEEQILEAVSVAAVMGGGPAYTHIPVVVQTLEAVNVCTPLRFAESRPLKYLTGGSYLGDIKALLFKKISLKKPKLHIAINITSNKG